MKKLFIEELEKRRSLSPALVAPVQEAQAVQVIADPGPGRKIDEVKLEEAKPRDEVIKIDEVIKGGDLYNLSSDKFMPDGANANVPDHAVASSPPLIRDDIIKVDEKIGEVKLDDAKVIESKLEEKLSEVIIAPVDPIATEPIATEPIAIPEPVDAVVDPVETIAK